MKGRFKAHKLAEWYERFFFFALKICVWIALCQGVYSYAIHLVILTLVLFHLICHFVNENMNIARNIARECHLARGTSPLYTDNHYSSTS